MLRYFLINILITDLFFAVYGCHSIPVLIDFTKLGVDILNPKEDRTGKYRTFYLTYFTIPNLQGVLDLSELTGWTGQPSGPLDLGQACSRVWPHMVASDGT